MDNRARLGLVSLIAEQVTMSSEGDAACRAQERRYSLEEGSASTKQLPEPQVDLATGDNRTIDNTATDAAAGSQERRDLHNDTHGGSAKSSRQHSPDRWNKDITAKHGGDEDAGLLSNPHRTSTRQETQPPRPSRTPEPTRNSFDDLHRWPRAWRAEHTTRAHEVELPLSTSPSLVSVLPNKPTLGLAWSSLEQLELRVEDIPLPESSGRTSPEQPDLRSEDIPLAERSGKKQKDDADPESFWGWVRKKRRKKIFVPSRVPAVAVEVADYRSNIRVLAHRLTDFENVAVTATRHPWSPRIVYYDHFPSGWDGQDRPYRRNEPWENQSSAPAFEDFRKTLRNVSDHCIQRIVLVEDLTPNLIELLGATFQVPPHVFEEHLDRSGYTKDLEGGDRKKAWHSRASTQGFSSVTWFRPVLPLVPVTSRLRSKLISDRKPRVRCPFDGCQAHGHNLRLNTQANIWRHQLDLCPEPGVYHKDSDTEYPVGWEERATMWARNYDECQFSAKDLDRLLSYKR